MWYIKLKKMHDFVLVDFDRFLVSSSLNTESEISPEERESTKKYYLPILESHGISIDKNTYEFILKTKFLFL